MLLTTTNNNLFDTFFSDPWFNDPWFDDRDVQKAQKKLYGHNGKRMMLTDINACASVISACNSFSVPN